MIRALRTGEPNAASKKNADELIRQLGIYPAFRYHLDQYTYGNDAGMDGWT